MHFMVDILEVLTADEKMKIYKSINQSINQSREKDTDMTLIEQSY